MSETSQPTPATTANSGHDWQTRLTDGDNSLRVHLIGIGGAGLSAIAALLLQRGLQVSGSDRLANLHTARLATAGAHIYSQQTAANLLDLAASARPDLVLVSSAVAPDNPERLAATQLQIPVVKRDRFLPSLLARHQVIGVAGSHGKSTTAAMIVKVLHESGIDAGYIIGTELPGFGNASAGKSEIFVIEADEYDQMFLCLQPAVAVITNVEWDHPDCYPTPNSFRQAFAHYVRQVPASGLVISCADDAGAEELRLQQQGHSSQWVRYGTSPDADLQAVNPSSDRAGDFGCHLTWRQTPIGTLQLQVPGLHNLRNALAVICVAHRCGVPTAAAATSLAHYAGTPRRFELKGIAKGVTIIDDYAHHPTEVRATLSGARYRYPKARIWAVFQPHTFSRTRALLAEMAQSFGDADQVIVTDIYPARETDDGTLHATDLVAASPHQAIRHLPGLWAIAQHLAHRVEPGDLVITLGAGDSYRIGELLLGALESGDAAKSEGIC